MNKERIFRKIKQTKQYTPILIIGLLVVGLYAFTKDTNKNYSYSGNSTIATQSLGYDESMDMGMFKSARIESDMAESYLPAPSVNEAPYDEQSERQLIKNGSLNLVVKDIAAARTQIENIVLSNKGFVASNSFGQSYNRNEYAIEPGGRYGSMVLRIPTNNYEASMTQLREIALVVTSDNTNSSDVTEQYADLQLRLENKLAEEAQYRQILKKAAKISDILEVTRYVEQARSDAERLEGQLNVLSNQIELSTINVYLESEQQYEIAGVSWSPWDNIRQSYQNLLVGLTGLVDKLVAMAVMLPLLIVYALLAWFVYTVLRKVYKRVRG